MSEQQDQESPLARERLEEIVALTRLLHAHEGDTRRALDDMNLRCAEAYDLLVRKDEIHAAQIAKANERAEWFRALLKIAFLAKGGARGRKVLPGSDFKKRVQEAGLFDEGSYLANNVDVQESGADALTHFIFHGLDEKRMEI